MMDQQFQKMLDNPYDPGLWRSYYVYDKELEPSPVYNKLGRNDIIGVYWLRNLRRVVKRQKLSLFITIDGRHRSGKSRCAVTIGSIFDKTFEKDPESRIVKTATELLDLVEKIDREKILDPVIVIDEAGTSLGATEWFEKMQKACMQTLQIIGYLHPTIFFIAPVRDMMLSGIRKMSHVHFKVERSNNKFTSIIPYEINYSTIKGKYFYKKYKILYLGQNVIIRRIRWSMPPKHIDERYDKFEMEKKPEMLKNIRSDATKVEIKKAREIPNIEELAALVFKNPDRFISKSPYRNESKTIIDENRISMEFRLPIRWCRLVKQEAEQKLARRVNNGNEKSPTD